MNPRLLCLSTLLATTLTVTAAVFDQPTNKVTDKQGTPTGIKHLIVVDFYVPDAAMKQKDGLLQNGPIRRGLFNRQDNDDSSQKAREMSNLLAKSLTEKLNDNEELQKLGIEADRESVPTEPTSTDTLVIDGAFVYVDDGGRLLQSGIGFGAGASKVELETEILDYSKTPCVQVLKIGSHSNPRRGPGAILMMNPYVLAAKFVLSKDSSEKDVKKIAASLAKEIANFLTGKSAATKQQ